MSSSDRELEVRGMEVWGKAAGCKGGGGGGGIGARVNVFWRSSSMVPRVVQVLVPVWRAV